MTRYKPYSYDQTKLIPVSYDLQILPGTFEHTLSEVIDTLYMGIFEGRYCSQIPPLEVVACFLSRHVGTENKKARLCLDEPSCSPDNVGTGSSGSRMQEMMRQELRHSLKSQASRKPVGEIAMGRSTGS